MDGNSTVSSATLAVAAALGIATAALLGFAGRTTWHRRVGSTDVVPSRALAVWWYSAAAVIALQAVRPLLFLAGVRDPAAYTALSYAGSFPLATAVWGLMVYILYLLTGRRGVIVPLTVLYAAYLGFLLWFNGLGGPRTLTAGEWQVSVAAADPPSATLTLLFGLLLAGPLVFATTAFVVLAVRLSAPTQRYRLVLLAGGFLFLFGTILVAYLVGWSRSNWFALLYESAALVTASLAVLAYRPPAWVRRRFGVEGVVQE